MCYYNYVVTSYKAFFFLNIHKNKILMEELYTSKGIAYELKRIWT